MNQPMIPALGIEKMQSVIETFIGAYQQVINNTVGAAKVNVLEFVTRLVLEMEPFTLLTEEGVAFLLKEVYGNEEKRSFVLRLTFAFFSRLAFNDNEIEALADALTKGCAFDRTEMNKSRHDFLAIPKELTARLPQSLNAYAVLSTNKWIMTIVLLQLAVEIDTSGIKTLDKRMAAI